MEPNADRDAGSDAGPALPFQARRVPVDLKPDVLIPPLLAAARRTFDLAGPPAPTARCEDCARRAAPASGSTLPSRPPPARTPTPPGEARTAPFPTPLPPAPPPAPGNRPNAAIPANSPSFPIRSAAAPPISAGSASPRRSLRSRT